MASQIQYLHTTEIQYTLPRNTDCLHFKGEIMVFVAPWPKVEAFKSVRCKIRNPWDSFFQAAPKDVKNNGGASEFLHKYQFSSLLLQMKISDGLKPGSHALEHRLPGV